MKTAIMKTNKKARTLMPATLIRGRVEIFGVGRWEEIFAASPSLLQRQLGRGLMLVEYSRIDYRVQFVIRDEKGRAPRNRVVGWAFSH